MIAIKSAAAAELHDAGSNLMEPSVRNEAVCRVVGRRLRLMRRNLDLTQAQVAKRCDMSFQQIQKYEAGQVDISVGTLVDLANALGVSIAELVSDLPARRPENGAATGPRASSHDDLAWLERSRYAP